MNKLENKNRQNRVPLSPLNEGFAIKRKFLILTPGAPENDNGWRYASRTYWK